MHLLPFNKLGSGYIEQQWFLNYSSGFIRRGLFGELIKWGDLDLKDLYLFFRFLITISFAAYFGIVWHSFGRINSKNIPYFLILVTSPIFYSAYSKLNGRFDLIFTLIITVLFIIKNQKKSRFLLLVSILPLGLLHEIWLIFYVPVYIILNRQQKLMYQDYLILSVNYLILAFLWWFTRTPPNDVLSVCQEIISKLESISYECNSYMHLSFSTQSIKDAVRDVFFGNRKDFKSVYIPVAGLIMTISYILISALPIYKVLTLSKPRLYLEINKIFLIFTLYLGLCVISLDWGRFLVDLIQILFLNIFIKNKIRFDDNIDKYSFIGLMAINLLFIKLPFTNIGILVYEYYKY